MSLYITVRTYRFYFRADLISFPEPSISIAESPATEDAAQAFTPAPSFDAVNIASPHSTASGNSTVTVDPFKSLALRRMSGSSLYTTGPVTPLSSPTTAHLLRHFMDNLASWVCMLLSL